MFDVLRFGPLDSFAAYSLENLLKILKISGLVHERGIFFNVPLPSGHINFLCCSLELFSANCLVS